MRIKLHLETLKGNLLPFNYEYAISAWIYKTLSDADPVFATWLHDQGYSLKNNNKHFKLFTFSQIQAIKPYRVDRRRGIILASGEANLTLSFLIDKAMQDFVIGLFNHQSLHIRIRGGQVSFKIVNVEILPEPTFSPIMKFWTNKPVFMSKKTADSKHAVYISPDDQDYKTLIINNLIEKSKALGLDINASLTDFKSINRPQSRMYNIDSTNVRAFNFDFIIAAPIELIRIGYFGGFGGKNSSLGLGFCEVIQD